LSLRDKELAREFKEKQIHLKNNGLRKQAKAVCDEWLDISRKKKILMVEKIKSVTCK